MNLLMNTEVLCFLTILMIVLTLVATGFLAILYSVCAIGFVGIIWLHEINDDLDDVGF